MNFADATPATTVNTVTSPDGKWTYTVTTTTTTTTTLAVASPDGTIILTDKGASIFDSLNTWTVVKGVVQLNGVAMAGTNNVAKLVWKSGVIWQTNGTLWWSWDDINQVWVTGPAPI
jgi:20S proteasome alpha/beta subunit